MTCIIITAYTLFIMNEVGYNKRGKRYSITIIKKKYSLCENQPMRIKRTVRLVYSTRNTHLINFN